MLKYLMISTDYQYLFFNPDRDQMEKFALKYGLTWKQVKTRIMNVKKERRQKKTVLALEMGI